jgi:tRNA dimethylallyltransferase
MARVIAVVGPTAAGKSRLAVELAQALDGEIVSADALQVYRGFDIGTAKPSREEQAAVRHHLIDILEPDERYSAGEFARRARLAIESIAAAGRWAIVAGGSGLYVRALFDGISPLPPGDAGTRDELERRLADEGLAALRRELEERDPATAARLEAGDRQRTLRALEVVLATGRTLSDWIADRPFGARQLAAVRVGLTLPRTLLYDRIEARIGQMIGAGWVEEVARLLATGLDPSLPAFQAIGYSQIARYLRGRGTLEEALSATLLATRRYAKRQSTWFRRDSEIHWISGGGGGKALSEALELLRRLQMR